MNSLQKCETIVKQLGVMGRMIEKTPNTLLNVCVDDGNTPLWYGDIDMLYDIKTLSSLAKEMQTNLYIRREYFKPDILLSFDWKKLP